MGQRSNCNHFCSLDVTLVSWSALNKGFDHLILIPVLTRDIQVTIPLVAHTSTLTPLHLSHLQSLHPVQNASCVISWINLRRTAFHGTFPLLLLPGAQSSYFLPTRGCNSHVRERCKLVKRFHRKHVYTSTLTPLVWFPDPSCVGGAREGSEGRVW